MSEVLAATTPARLAASRSRFNALPAACQRPGGDRAGTCFRAAACRQPAHAGAAATISTGSRVMRSQDNFVVQWGDPDGKRPLGAARRRTAAGIHGRECLRHCRLRRYRIATAMRRRWDSARDFRSGRDAARGEAWLAHCYGMVGAGRATKPNSGNGTELYVVTGHAPRQLDRNIALVGSRREGHRTAFRACRAARDRSVSTRNPSSTCRSPACGSQRTCRLRNAMTCRCCARTRRVLLPSSRRAAIEG